MPDRILKPDSGNDLILQNDDASGKIEINEDATINFTGTVSEFQVDNIKVDGNTISSTNTNGEITIDTNGTGDINLTAGADVNIPANIGLTFGDDGEKIEGNNTDLSLMSGSDINLDATNDVNIPANVGMTFGDDGEKIEGDGSHLTVFSSGDININSGTLNLSNQTVDVTLNASVDALNFDSNTLSIDALNNRVGIGTSAPDMQFHLSTSENNLMHLQSTDQDALFKISDSGGHFQINTANDNTSLGTSHSGEMMRFSSTGGPDSEEIIVFNEDSNNQSLRIESDVSAWTFFVKGSNGRIGIGTDSPYSKLTVEGTFGDDAQFLTLRSTGTVLYRALYFTNTHLYFWNGSNNPYLSGTGTWTNASDIAIKKDIEDIHYGLETVNALKPRRYKHKACNTEDIGFVAQEVEGIVPEVVTGGEDEKTGKGLSYGNLTAVLTKAIQELSAKVTALEKG
jgi:hypothetical protein